ncbi:MAG: TetR/AcrR family transcriptional regulator [candidate division KSB1 bacterium]|nr:TetR/AcrR family transcriptional regulator [candidate division KSB1 bacterium]
MSYQANSESSPRLELLLNAARELFYRYGVRRVTVEEICAKADVSKMTFYKFFDNKADLVKHLLSRMIAEGEGKFSQIISSDAPFAEKIRQLIDLKLDFMREMSSEFMLEILNGSLPEVQPLVEEASRRQQEQFLNFVRRSQEQGYIRKDLHVGLHLYLLDRFTEMVNDPRLLQLYPSPAELVKDLLNFYFYGILSRP